MNGTLNHLAVLVILIAVVVIPISFTIQWYRRTRIPKFKPCVFYNAEVRLTEILLEDTCTVWAPWGPLQGHAVDCGYDLNGDLVGIRIWDDVRNCNKFKPTKYIGEVKWT